MTMSNLPTLTAEQEAAVAWWEQISERTVPIFRNLYFDEHRYLVLMGGGGSGKSIFAGQKILERCTTEPRHKMLVVRKVANTLGGSCFEQLCSQAMKMYPECVSQIVKSPMEIRFRNGSKIIFRGLDDVEKLKSIYGITGIWIEEASEITEADFNQLDIRLRDQTRFYKQIIISFNPISIVHWLKKRFFDKTDPKAAVSRSTYKDNPFLSEEAVQTLENFRETDEYYYMVYALGEWGVTGRTVFSARKVSERLQEILPPVSQGYFLCTEDAAGNILHSEWVEDDRNPLILIYEHPNERRHYVIGGDTAGDGSDAFVGQVLDNIDGRQVAKLTMTTGEHEYVRQMYCLGKYYREALIGIESNFSSYPINELQRIGYPKMYVEESIDQYTHRPVQKFGFRTTKLSRNSIIAKLIKIVNENTDCINDRRTLEEMLTFVRNEDFRPEAEDGAHDDHIMALAIAYEIRGQQTYTEDAIPGVTRAWTQDMWSDYNRASADERRHLISIWGNPK